MKFDGWHVRDLAPARPGRARLEMMLEPLLYIGHHRNSVNAGVNESIVKLDRDDEKPVQEKMRYDRWHAGVNTGVPRLQETATS